MTTLLSPAEMSPAGSDSDSVASVSNWLDFREAQSPGTTPATPALPASPATSAGFDFPSAALLKGLVVSMLVLLAMHLMVVVSFAQGHEFRGAKRFYLDEEGNLPAYFSTFIIFLAAVLLSVITAFKRADKDRFFGRWLVMTLLFFGMALDEALSFHEVLIDPLRSAFGFSGLLRFPWVLLGASFVLGFAWAYVPFLAHLSQPLRRLFLASGIVYVTGALGFEMAGGPFFEAHEAGGSGIPYMVLMTIEEVLEMSGILLFIHALLRYLKAYRPAFSVRLR